MIVRILLPIVTFALGIGIGGAGTRSAVEFSRAPSADELVTGIGGVFFKVDDPERSRAWYRTHLGMDGGTPGINFFWREPDDAASLGFTVWSVFPKDSDYFGPGGQSFMVNYRVSDLDALLAKLREQGVQQAGKVEAYAYGRFAWITDGDGNRVELWEPTHVTPDPFERRVAEEREALHP